MPGKFHHHIAKIIFLFCLEWGHKGAVIKRVIGTDYRTTDPLDDPLEDTVKTSVKTLVKRLKRLKWPTWWPACVPFNIILDFLAPPAMCPLPLRLPDNLSITVVLEIPTFLAMALIDSCCLGGRLSFWAHRSSASCILEAYHSWFLFPLWLMLSLFSWAVNLALPDRDFFENFCLAIVWTLQLKSV